MPIRNVRDLPASQREAIKALRDPSKTKVEIDLVSHRGEDGSLMHPETEEEVTTPEVQETEDLFDLDAGLDAISAEVQQSVPEEPVEQVQSITPAEQMRVDILSMLSGHPDAPSEDQIEAWKAKVGQDGLQVIAFDRTNVFIFTHLTLRQWERIQEIMQEAQKSGQGADLQKKLRDTVVRSAVLWPRLQPEWFDTARAGLPDTLYELILVNSYFLSTQQAMTLTTQL